MHCAVVGVSEVRALTAFHFEFSTASKMAACCVAESRRKAQGSAKCEEVYGIGGYSLAISTSLPMECVCVWVCAEVVGVLYRIISVPGPWHHFGDFSSGFRATPWPDNDVNDGFADVLHTFWQPV